MKEIGFPLDRSPLKSLCRPPLHPGFARRTRTTSEAGSLLSAYLGITPESEARLTSHSMKATVLVWSARYGMGEMARTILRHHAVAGDSLACYSRDLMARPLRLMNNMLEQIRCDRYRPDATRSGWLAPGPQDEAKRQPLPEEGCTWDQQQAHEASFPSAAEDPLEWLDGEGIDPQVRLDLESLESRCVGRGGRRKSWT